MHIVRMKDIPPAPGCSKVSNAATVLIKPSFSRTPVTFGELPTIYENGLKNLASCQVQDDGRYIQDSRGCPHRWRRPRRPDDGQLDGKVWDKNQNRG